MVVAVEMERSRWIQKKIQELTGSVSDPTRVEDERGIKDCFWDSSVSYGAESTKGKMGSFV